MSEIKPTVTGNKTLFFFQSQLRTCTIILSALIWEPVILTYSTVVLYSRDNEGLHLPTIGQEVFVVLNFHALLECGKISNFRGTNFHGLDIDLHTTYTGTTKYLLFVGKTPAKSTKYCIPTKISCPMV